LRHGSSTL